MTHPDPACRPTPSAQAGPGPGPLATAAHELRTPFQGVLGLLSLLGDSPLLPRQRRWVDTAQRATRQLLGLLDEALVLARAEADDWPVRPEAVDLPALLEAVCALMQPLADAKGLRLVLQRSPGLPGSVWLDPMRLQQILYNLIGNAIRCTEAGEVAVHVARLPDDAAAPVLLLQVRDTGPGLGRAGPASPDGPSPIDPTAPAAGGRCHGLGLVIAHRLAHQLGGTLASDAGDGPGTVFHLRLPCPPPPGSPGSKPLAMLPDEGPHPAPPGAGASAAQGDPAADPGDAPTDDRHDDPTDDLSGLRLLVCDDLPVNRQLMGALLQAWGAEVHLAADGRQAVDRVAVEPFDAVLMDLHMPQLDGLAATQAIRLLPGPAGRVPVIAVTADALARTRLAARAAGMDGFIAKPVRPDSLLAEVQRCVAAAASSPPGPLHRGLDTPGHRPADGPSAPAPDAQPADAEGDEPPLDPMRLARLTGSLPPERHRAIALRLLEDERGYCAALRQALQRGDAAAVAAAAAALQSACDALALSALARWAGTVACTVTARPTASAPSTRPNTGPTLTCDADPAPGGEADGEACRRADELHQLVARTRQALLAPHSPPRPVAELVD